MTGRFAEQVMEDDREWDRWRGGVDARLSSQEGLVKTLALGLDEVKREMSGLRADMASLKTKVAVAASVGSIMGSSLVGTVLLVASKHF